MEISHDRTYLRLDSRPCDGRSVVVVGRLVYTDGRVIRPRETLRPGGIAHEAGTARMGRTSREGVVDSIGKVFGVRGLYAADASVMPTVLDRRLGPVVFILSCCGVIASRQWLTCNLPPPQLQQRQE